MRKSPSCHTCAEYVCKMYSFVYSGSRQHDTKYAGSFLDQTTVRTLLTDRAFQCNSATRDHLWRSEAAASRDAGVTLQCSFGIQHVSTACTCCDFLFSLDAPFQLFFFFFSLVKRSAAAVYQKRRRLHIAGVHSAMHLQSWWLDLFRPLEFKWHGPIKVMPQPRYERAECNFHNEKNGVAPRVGQGSLKPFVARECRGNALTAHIPYLKKKNVLRKITELFIQPSYV